MMMMGSWGEPCGTAALKYAAMISSNANTLFLLKVDLAYTACEGRRPGTDPRELLTRSCPKGPKRVRPNVR
jgi:hypothetical protein